MELSARNLYDLFRRYSATINAFAAVCQCRHETSFKGKPWNSELCLKANNLAGIKVWGGWAGEIFNKESWEQSANGNKYNEVSAFCKYPSVESFVENYVLKISKDYPVCTLSADNFFGYFSGLFRGRLGSWATDQNYLPPLLKQANELGDVFFAGEWPDKAFVAFEYAQKHKRLTASHAQIIELWLAGLGKKPTPVSTGKRHIVIDPGHGQPDPGAGGKGGTQEYVVTMAVATFVREYLTARGFDVTLTRTGSKALNAVKSTDLRMRYEVANKVGADAFISIHCNGAANAKATGFEIYTTRGQNNSDKLATAIYDAWGRQIGGVLRPDMSDGDPDKEADFAVIKGTRCPSCLTELAFITNSDDEAKLRNPEWQMKAAAAICSGIEDYFR